MKTYKKMIHEVKATYDYNNQINAAKISRSQDVNEYIRQIFPVDLSHREAMVALYLNRATLLDTWLYQLGVSLVQYAILSLCFSMDYFVMQVVL